ncbi:MAG TPA: YibE/F family protein [Actinomycetota bacterium]|nr:YibE/F family protein [Actinomycetota bacterium]
MPLRTRRTLAAVAAALAIATLAGILLLRPQGSIRRDLAARGVSLPTEVYDGRVLAVRDGPCQGTVPEQNIVCSRISVGMHEGPHAGRTVSIERPKTEGSIPYGVGDDVVLAYEPRAPQELRYRIVDRERGSPLIWLTLLFAGAVVALGRFRGVAALAGLAATFLVLLMFVLPSILEGRSPLMVSVVGASAIAFLALYLAHGFGPKTTVALLGTLASLILTAVLASVFVEAAQISGLASEEATIIRIGAAQIDLSGLILGGVVIGALGAIDDMTVTQASAVWELRTASPQMSRGDLVRSGLRIGRDHVAATVNTLFLAYAGASMPLLILFVLSRQSLVTVANGEVVATEIVRTLVGSVGLVASVPITTWLAAHIAPAPSPGAAPAPASTAAGGAAASKAAGS